MFGQGGSAEERALRRKENQSILDAVSKDAKGMERVLGSKDNATLDEYLDNIREIERRLQRASIELENPDLTVPEAPVGIPYSFEEHIKLMYDLLALAYQADVTRVFSFMVAREVSNRTYPQVGVPDGHHATSHHQNKAEKIDKLIKIQTYHAALFAHFLDKLNSTKDGDGSLLDHSVILYGSNMSNSNLHNHFPLPNVLAGGAAGRLQGGRHLRYADHTPMANLLLTMLDKAGVPQETLGDSTGRLADV
jgi:hypothetical protein